MISNSHGIVFQRFPYGVTNVVIFFGRCHVQSTGDHADIPGDKTVCFTWQEKINVDSQI